MSFFPASIGIRKKKAEELWDVEKRISVTFAQRSPPFVSQRFSGEWDTLFFMQHYGIPTRLLDWSESPFIALYFSLSNTQKDRRGKPKNDAALWLLRPSEWNESALRDISFPGGILHTSDEQTKSYSPSVALNERKNLPVMIYGTHNSARIVAQRGMFSIFGKEVKSLKAFYEDGAVDEGILEQIVIKADKIESITSSLFRKGISDSSIYPDLHGLALEMRRSYGFS